MSDVIDAFIRQHPASREEDAFAAFVAQDKIARWVGQDAARRERLREEFQLAWARAHPPAARPPPPVARPPPPPSAPPRPEPVAPAASAPSAAAAPPATGTAAHLHVLCSQCHRAQVWRTGERVECRHCGKVYDDLLDLVPVRPLGPFAFVFGEGPMGWLRAAGVAALLLAIYGVLRWL